MRLGRRSGREAVARDRPPGGPLRPHPDGHRRRRTLLLAGITGAAVPGGSLPGLVIALVLLGVGWNIGLISGTALVIDGTEPANRPRVQGTIDVLIALSGAGGGAVSGIVKAQTDYATLALGGGALAVLLIPAVFVAQRSR